MSELTVYILYIIVFLSLMLAVFCASKTIELEKENTRLLRDNDILLKAAVALSIELAESK